MWAASADVELRASCCACYANTTEAEHGTAASGGQWGWQPFPWWLVCRIIAWQQDLFVPPGTDLCIQEAFVLVCIRSMKPWIQEVSSSLDLWAHSESPLTPGSVSLPQLDLWSLIWSRKHPLSFIWSCWFWPSAPGSVLSTYTRSMEPLLVMTSNGKCPLRWMDGGILISFRKQAKYCVDPAPSSSLLVNEPAAA